MEKTFQNDDIYQQEIGANEIDQTSDQSVWEFDLSCFVRDLEMSVHSNAWESLAEFSYLRRKRTSSQIQSSYYTSSRV